MAAPDERQVTLRLTTQLPERFRVPATALAVPARLTRYGLSEVVNTLLQHCAPRQPPSVSIAC
jgi:ribosome biogenesis protein YTM1